FAPEYLSFPLRSSQASNNPLRKPCVFLLGNGRENRNHRLFEHSSRVQVSFREALPRHAVAVENLEMVQRLGDAFAAESVQGPKEHKIKFLEACILEQRQERLAVRFGAARPVGVLNVLPALTLAIFRELQRLIRCILSVRLS